MLISRVAIRYAKSILQLAIEQGKLEGVYADMLLVKKTCDESKDLALMLKSPVVKADKKTKVMEAIFEGKITEISAKFFNIVIRKNRAELIRDVAQSFIDQYKIHKHISIVTVETAKPLSAENKARMLTFLKDAIKNDAELVEKVNEELIGGIIFRLDDQQIDASVKSNIENLKRAFSKDLYTTKY